MITPVHNVQQQQQCDRSWEASSHRLLWHTQSKRPPIIFPSSSSIGHHGIQNKSTTTTAGCSLPSNNVNSHPHDVFPSSNTTRCTQPSTAMTITSFQTSNNNVQSPSNNNANPFQRYDILNARVFRCLPLQQCSIETPARRLPLHQHSQRQLRLKEYRQRSEATRSIFGTHLCKKYEWKRWLDPLDTQGIRRDWYLILNRQRRD